MGQRAWSMSQREAHGSLVDGGLIDFEFIIQDEEPREVLFICLYALCKNVKTIKLRSEGRCYCTDALELASATSAALLAVSSDSTRRIHG